MPPRVSAFLSRSTVIDFFLLVIIVGIAAGFRFYHLTSLPVGFHGDEAVSGLEGERILREGFIGPYTRMALGEPTGPIYLTALFLRLFGSTIWAVRAVSALVGAFTVGLCYWLVRRYYNAPDAQKRAVALLSAAFLATSYWHLFYSRIGFPVIVWPLCTLLAIGAAAEATRREEARWWSITGLLLGAGIYSYNAHLLCVLSVGLWLLFYLSRQRRAPLPHRAFWLFAVGIMGFLVAAPMIRYAVDPTNNYFEHVREISVFHHSGSQWHELKGGGSKALFLLEHYLGFWNNLSFGGQVDGGDASGIVPLVPLLTLVVAAVGLIRGWKAKRGTLVEMSLFFVLILPLGPMVTLEGLTRRGFALAPFLALLTAVGIVEIYLWASTKWPSCPQDWSRKVAPVGAVLLSGLIIFQNLFNYFVRTASAEPIEWTFGREMTETCGYFNSLPIGTHVYFYSDRWSSSYDTLVFLSPHISIEDRSKEHGTFSFAADPGKGTPYFVLLGSYRNYLGQLRKMYPHSQIDQGPRTLNGQPTFIALHLDK